MSDTPRNPLSSVNFHRLRFLSVIGGFLDGQTFEFSEGLNCVIGARGTGKTTALELIRYRKTPAIAGAGTGAYAT